MAKRGPKRRPIAQRFWGKVAFSEGCWLWTGHKNNRGYGYIGKGGDRPVGGSHFLAHRVSWEIHFGPIPDGLFCLHHCDTPACVRPDHLFLGTQKDNIRDAVAKGRARGQFPKGIVPWNKGKRAVGSDPSTS